MTDDVFHQFFPFQAFWVVLHFIYFSKYYSRYSECFDKLNSIQTMEKAEVITTEVSQKQQQLNLDKAAKLKCISYYPTLGIGLLNQVALYLFWGSYFFSEYYYVPICFTIGALVFIFLANVTQGSKVLGVKQIGGFGPWI